MIQGFGKTEKINRSSNPLILALTPVILEEVDMKCLRETLEQR